MNYFILIPVFVAYFSVIEWLLHRFVMHNGKLKWFQYPFQTHAVTHHQKFKSDCSYHAKGHEDDIKKIPMAWWNGPVLVLISSTPSFILSLMINDGWISIMSILIGLSYYGTYEYLHWCMHLPKARLIEKPRFFRYLNGHHILHHRYMGKNFNVVLPFADLCFRTLLIRSPIKFSQVRGESVPDVQPLNNF